MLDFLSGISTFILTLAAGAVRLRNRALSTGLSRSATHPLVISTIVLPTVLGTILQLFNVREVGSFALSIALSGVVFLSWPIIVDIIRHVNSRRSDALLLAGISTVFGVLGGAEFLSIGGQTLPAVWLSSLAPYLKPDLLVIGGLGLIGTLAGASADLL